VANKENITAYKWEKGKSGNPKGRPVGSKSLKNRLLVMIDKPIKYQDLENKSIDTTVGEAIALALVARAIHAGDIKAIEMITSAVEGNQPKDTELSEVQKTIVQRAFERHLALNKPHNY
jgi:hypothetical protein